MPLGTNIAIDFAAGELPQDPPARDAVLATVSGRLIAWDPIEQREAWGVDYEGANNGGTLATAGGLVFQGSKSGQFAAFNAFNGERLWETQVYTAAIAAPVSFTVDGVQHIAILVGSGGVEALAPGAVGAKGGGLPNRSRVLVYSLEGKASLPVPEPEQPRELNPLGLEADPGKLEVGKSLYARFCGMCHGDGVYSAGLIPDLRYSSSLTPEAFNAVVLDGALVQNGMVSFAEVLDEESADAVRNFIIARANENLAQEHATMKSADE